MIWRKSCFISLKNWWWKIGLFVMSLAWMKTSNLQALSHVLADKVLQNVQTVPLKRFSSVNQLHVWLPSCCSVWLQSQSWEVTRKFLEPGMIFSFKANQQTGRSVVPRHRQTRLLYRSTGREFGGMQELKNVDLSQGRTRFTQLNQLKCPFLLKSLVCSCYCNYLWRMWCITCWSMFRMC